MRRVIFAFFALQMVLTIHGQNTYSLGNSELQSTWFKLGTLSLDQQGRDAIIRISGGHGYNATIDQNAESVIHFRTSGLQKIMDSMELVASIIQVDLLLYPKFVLFK